MRKSILACGAVLALAACGDPLAGVERFSDTDVVVPADADAALDMAAAPEEADARPGLFAVAGNAQESPVRQARAGLFGGLFASLRGAPTADVQTASLVPVPGVQPHRNTNTKAMGTGNIDRARGADLGGRPLRLKNAPATGPDQADVAVGTMLPFGEIARVCAARDLGKAVERAGRGRAQFTLYDSEPGSTAPRIFYVTGFQDGCPRQFTAALALFGDPAMHEQLRYGRPSETYPYSTTDKAYERVKTAICGVARRKPCGGQITTLSRSTVFISSYERFTDNGRWADMLLHDGAVLAAAVKDL